ncbi:MAG: long-chain fatty acid--CoA ligase [Betaproteobacteria bacterium]|nr:MAG: long-chain fatty acid--CoA ligase [Betaproteobacteria bacterium]
MEAKRSIIDYLADHARRSPDAAVVHYKDRTVSFRELEERSARARGALTALGIKHGDRGGSVQHHAEARGDRVHAAGQRREAGDRHA